MKTLGGSQDRLAGEEDGPRKAENCPGGEWNCF